MRLAGSTNKLLPGEAAKKAWLMCQLEEERIVP